MSDPVVMAKVAHFGLHSYLADGAGSDGVADFIQESPYPDVTFWMTEYNVWCQECEDGESGTNDWTYDEGTAQYLFNHLANGASAAMVWEGYDSIYFIRSPTWSFWGLFAVDDTNAVDLTYTPRKNFYTLSQISKFVQPGAYSIYLDNNSPTFAPLMAFWQPVTGQFTLTGINTDTGPDPLSVTLASLPVLSSLELYYTDANSNLVDLATVPVTNGTDFTAMIPADCVFTLVGNPVIFTGVTNPANGAQFTAPATIPIQAFASTANGTISEVDFYNGATILGAATAPPYGIIWSNVPPGIYSLTVNASNSVGNSAVSPPVQVSVVGPMAQIFVQPSNIALAPASTQLFTATAADALGTAFNLQPAFVWSATGGVIDSNGLFTAGSAIGGPFTITASNNSFTGSASFNILSDIAFAGAGYTWYSMSNSTQNSPIAPAPAINDGDLLTDGPLLPGGGTETSESWEAAGVIWSSSQTINQVTYINGSYDQNNNGVFAAGFGLQFSPDGMTWTNAGPEWSVAPAYTYNAAASGDVNFNFTGGQVLAQGVRCIGLVHTSDSPGNSWAAAATEVEVYAAISLPVLQAGVTATGVLISWSASATNFLLETTSDPAPPYTWSPVTNAPQFNGAQQQILVTPSAGQQLFRLHQQ